MRKFLSLMMATFFSVGLFAATYTVAGDQTVLGSNWDINDANNEMALVDGVYTLVKEGVTLGANTYEYKVVKDHNWDAMPIQNQKFTVQEDGVYDVTFTFNESEGTGSIKAEAEKKGSAVVEKHYLVVGQKEIANGKNWDNDADANVMATADNGLTYTLTIEDLELTKATDYQYKIVEKGSWTEYFPNLGGPNATFSVEETAKYTIKYVFTVATSKCEVQTTKSGDVEPGGGGDDPQPASKYYMKNNWNGGEWSWKEMAAAENNTFKLEKVVFGGTGVNYNTEESDTGAEWVEVAAFDGDEVGALDTVTFVLDLAAVKKVKAILLGKYQEGQGGGDDPQPEVTYLLIGSDPAIGGESWDGSKAVALVDGKATVTLQAGDCQFKVVPNDWNWEKALGFAQVDAECSSQGVVEGTDNNNIKVTMPDGGGDMTVEVKNGKLCVTGNFVTEGGGGEQEKSYLLIGSDPAIGGAEWDGSKAVALQNGKATVTLQAGECQFKVVPSDWNWDNALGFAQVNAECSSVGISEGDNGNVKITMAEAGEMTVEVKNGKLCVTGNFVTEGGGVDPQPVTPDGIYLSGSFNEWTAKDEFKFALNEGAEGEEYVLKATLAVNDQVKVVEVANGEWKWYPDGMDNAYIVDAEHAGKVTIYFQKTSKEDWAAFGGYMYIEVESGTGISNTVNDVKAQKFIENGQLFIIVNGATYTVMGQTR